MSEPKGIHWALGGAIFALCVLLAVEAETSRRSMERQDAMIAEARASTELLADCVYMFSPWAEGMEICLNTWRAKYSELANPPATGGGDG